MEQMMSNIEQKILCDVQNNPEATIRGICSRLDEYDRILIHRIIHNLAMRHLITIRNERVEITENGTNLLYGVNGRGFPL